MSDCNDNTLVSETQPENPIAALAARCTSEETRLFLEALQTHPKFAAVIEALILVEGALHEEHIAEALLSIKHRDR